MKASALVFSAHESGAFTAAEVLAFQNLEPFLASP